MKVRKKTSLALSWIFFREFKFISKPGLGQNQAHPCHCQQEAETDENKSSGPFFFWPSIGVCVLLQYLLLEKMVLDAGSEEKGSAWAGYSEEKKSGRAASEEKTAGGRE